MARLRPLPYRKVLKILKKHDSRFEEWTNSAKGSERMIYHPDADGHGHSASYPLKCHGGNTEIRKGHLSAIIRRFNLPRDIFR
jgi:hypothetical protein